jgi:hypothetical protein
VLGCAITFVMCGDVSASGAAQEIECSMVLMAVDEFFRQLGLTEIRRRSTSDDKPLRMVKTLLHELCKKKVG